jgi:hypothetical protein
VQLPADLCVRGQPAEAHGVRHWCMPHPCEASQMICEDVEDLSEHVFQSLPLRLRVIGRHRARDIVDTAVHEWPVQPLAHAPSAGHAEDVFATLEEQVKSSYIGRYGDKEGYGFAILTVVLIAAISAIVQQLVKWWMEKKLNKELMESWHNESRSDPSTDQPGEGDAEPRTGDE